jgi:hypothetical protein
MRDPDQHIRDILDKFGEDFATETWTVPGGKARAIKHACTERIVAKAGIFFDKPEIISADPNNVVIIVYGTIPKEGLQAWSFGEASPKNNKNAYVYAMAEKRAKGRVALKLLGLHGHLYDETEADDFKEARSRSGNSEVKSSRQAKADGSWSVVEDGIGKCDDSAALLAWAAGSQSFLRSFSLVWQEQAQEAWGKALAEKLASECHAPSEVGAWGVEQRRAIEALPPEWINTARAVCAEHLRSLRDALGREMTAAFHEEPRA